MTREYFGERAIGTAYGSIFFNSCIGTILVGASLRAPRPRLDTRDAVRFLR